MTVRCILVENSVRTFNLEGLSSFGEVVYLLPFNKGPRVITDCQKTVGAIVERLKKIDYKPDTDQIVFTGNIVLVSLFTMAALSFAESFRALVYTRLEGDTGRYIIQDVSISEYIGNDHE